MMNSELISALADGEIDQNDLSAALAATADASGQSAWTLYHQIGDTLRAADLGDRIGDDFAIRFAARFDAEPPLSMPRDNAFRRAMHAASAPLRTLTSHLGRTDSMKSVGRFLHLS